MAEKHPIRNGVIGTVVGGVILGALGNLWPPASHAFTSLWVYLTGTVAVPTWLLLLLGLIVIVSSLRAARGYRSGPSCSLGVHAHAALSPVSPAAVSIRLEVPGGLLPLEAQVLARLAKADGEPVARDTMKRSLGTTNLRLQAAEDRLVDVQLIEVLQSVEDEEDVVLVLTSRGRQYVVEHGLA